MTKPSVWADAWIGASRDLVAGAEPAWEPTGASRPEPVGRTGLPSGGRLGGLRQCPGLFRVPLGVAGARGDKDSAPPHRESLMAPRSSDQCARPRRSTGIDRDRQSRDRQNSGRDQLGETAGKRPAGKRPAAWTCLPRANLRTGRNAQYRPVPGLGAGPGPAPACDRIDGEGDEQHDPGDDVRGCCA